MYSQALERLKGCTRSRHVSLPISTPFPIKRERSLSLRSKTCGSQLLVSSMIFPGRSQPISQIIDVNSFRSLSSHFLRLLSPLFYISQDLGLWVLPPVCTLAPVLCSKADGKLFARFSRSVASSLLRQPGGRRVLCTLAKRGDGWLWGGCFEHCCSRGNGCGYGSADGFG